MERINQSLYLNNGTVKNKLNCIENPIITPDLRSAFHSGIPGMGEPLAFTCSVSGVVVEVMLKTHSGH